MPIVYRIDHELKVVIAMGYGILTDEDVFRYQRKVWSRKDVAGYRELIDMSRVERVMLPSPKRIRDLASMSARMDAPSGRSKLAVVAPRDELFGLGRMFQAYRDLEPGSRKDVAIFRSTEEATEFLELEVAPGLPEIP